MRTLDAVCKQTSACLHFFLSGPYEAKSEQIYWRATVNVQKGPPAVLSPSVMFAQSCHVAVLPGLYSHYGDSTWFVLNIESHWLVMVFLANVQLLQTH